MFLSFLISTFISTLVFMQRCNNNNYTFFSTKLAGLFTLHIYSPANILFDRAHVLLQACTTHIRCACTLCAQPRDAHLRGYARDYFCAWINLSLIISANLVLNNV